MKMQIVNVRALSDIALDWAVASCKYTDGRKFEGHVCVNVQNWPGSINYFRFNPSADCAYGAPIIFDNKIELLYQQDRVLARSTQQPTTWVEGRDALEAGLRAYVLSVVGENMEVPAVFMKPT